MNITIEKIVYPGKSLARIDGKVVFTDHGLPNETVEINVTKDTKDYLQAKTTKIIAPCDDRVQNRCSHYKVCSPYQYIDYPKQIEIKKEQLHEILTRQLKINNLKINLRQSPEIWGYRNKAKLKIIYTGKLACLAYNLPQSTDEFIPIDECFLLPEAANLLLKDFIKVLNQGSFAALNQITIRQNSQNQLLVCLYHNSFLETKDLSSCLESLVKKFNISGIILIDLKKNTKNILWGEEFLKEVIDDKIFFIGYDSFFQVNKSMLSILVKDLRDNLTLTADKTLADLYCGVGTFGILLASKLKNIIGIESEPENFFFLEKNIKLNNIENFSVRMCDCKEIIDSLLKRKTDIIIVDPPRKGMDSTICDNLVESPVPELVYISCNPATLVRDLKILLASYDIKNVYAYDFFPHTPHIETMVFLAKK